MQTRRALLGTLAGGTLASLAGCTLLGDEITESAQQAGVSDDALAETGYSHERTDKFDFEETLTVADESRDVRLTNYLTTYRKAAAHSGAEPDDIDGQFGSFGILSTPTVSIAGRDVNPFDRLDEQQLLKRLLDETEMEGIEDIEPVDEQTIDVLDEMVTLTEYEGRTEQDGFDVRLHLATLTNAGDFLALLGAYPDVLSEAENIGTLAQGTVHPVETET